MTLINITASEHPNYQGGGTSAILRIYSNQSFLTSDSVRIHKQKPSGPVWYQEIECDVDDEILTVPGFAIDSTTDSNKPNGTYTAILFDGNGSFLYEFLERFKVPHNLGASISYAQVVAYDDIALPNRPGLTYNQDQTAALIAASTQELWDAIEIEHNLNGYDSLASAITGIGASKTNLTIKSSITVSVNTTIPDTTTVDVKGDAIITVDPGVTLTIGNMKDPGTRKVFSGNGQVMFARGAVEEVNLAWFAGPTDSVDVSSALDSIFTSFAAAGGGNLFIPEGLWITDGGHTVPSGTRIRGAGSYAAAPVGSHGTCLRLFSPDTNVFYVGELTEGVRIESITLDGDNLANTRGVLCEGTYPDSSGNLICREVVFAYFVDGFKIHAIASPPNQWQFAHLSFDHCTFSSNTNSGFYCDTVNTGVRFDSCNFGVLNDGWGMYLQNTGALSANMCEFAGLSGQAACVGGIPGAAMAEGCVYIGGAHGPISFYSCPDEGFRYSIYNDAADLESNINIFGGQPQAVIFLNEPCTLNLYGGTYLSKTVKDAVGTASYVSAFSITIDDRDVCGNVVSPPVLTEFAGDSIVAIDMAPTTNEMALRQQVKVFSGELYDGDEERPVMIIGHQTGIGESKRLLRIGRLDAAEEPDFYYDLFRHYDTGYLNFVGNQNDPFKGFYFNANIQAQGLELPGLSAIVTRLLSNTAALNFGSIAANTTAELTIAVTNAAVGKVAWASPSTTLESGLIWSAYVSATDTVTIRVANVTVGAIDPASRSWTVWVIA